MVPLVDVVEDVVEDREEVHRAASLEPQPP